MSTAWVTDYNDQKTAKADRPAAARPNVARPLYRLYKAASRDAAVVSEKRRGGGKNDRVLIHDCCILTAHLAATLVAMPGLTRPGLPIRISRSNIMKKATTLVLALFTSATLAGAAHAGGSHHGPYADRMVKHMTEELSLTDQQQSQIKAIVEEQGAKMRALHKETKEQINQLLTPEQQAKAKTLHEERMKKWEEKKAQHKQHKEHHNHD